MTVTIAHGRLQRSRWNWRWLREKRVVGKGKDGKCMHVISTSIRLIESRSMRWFQAGSFKVCYYTVREFPRAQINYLWNTRISSPTIAQNTPLAVLSKSTSISALPPLFDLILYSPPSTKSLATISLVPPKLSMSLTRFKVASSCSRKPGLEQIMRKARCMETESART